MFADWVTAGGNLIAMRPDADLAGLLGLDRRGHRPLGRVPPDRHRRRQARRGARRPDDPVPWHRGPVRPDAGTEALATLYSTRRRPRPNPAVTLRTVGSNGGQAAAFTYDLARSVVYTRQGNPAWAGQERDGEQPSDQRSDDLFFPDWIDLNKVQIPQADEQQRLLANLIEQVNRDQMPLPRFWYFPRGEKAVVVMTGDDHAQRRHARPVRLGRLGAARPAARGRLGVRPRHLVHLPEHALSDAAAAAYEAQGFEIALHVNTNCADWTPASLDGLLRRPARRSSRADLPERSRRQPPTAPTASPGATGRRSRRSSSTTGIRLDTNYYYWPAAWVQDRPGYFTGSGMPMRFADLDGSLIDVYQAATQMTDESGIDVRARTSTRCSTTRSARPATTAPFTTNMHTDSASHPGRRPIVAAALARGVPVVSARQMLTWLDGRNGSSFAGPGLDRQHAHLLDRRRRRRQRTAGHAPDARARAARCQALTRDGNPVTVHDPDDQGHRVRRLRRGRRAPTRRPTTSTRPPRRSAPSQAVADAAAPPRSRGRPTSPRPRASTTAPSAGALDSYVDRRGADDVAHGPAHRPRPRHHLPLPGHLDRRRGNATTSPDPPAAPATFTTPTAVATDTTVADFGAGTTGARPTSPTPAGGEVILAPTVGAEFDGHEPARRAGRRARWTGGATTVGRRSAPPSTAPGSRADGLVGPGRVVEFAGTFSGATFQNAGLRRRPRRVAASRGRCSARTAPPASLQARDPRRRRSRSSTCPSARSTSAPAPLPDRVGHDASRFYDRRHPRAHRRHGRRHDAPDRQRLQHRRRRAVHRLDAHDAVRVARARSCPASTTPAVRRGLGRPVLRRRRARRDHARRSSVRTGDTPTPDGVLDPVRADRHGRATSRAPVATSSTGSRPPPRRASSPRRCQSVTLPYTRAADTDPPGDHRPHAGAERDRRPDRHRRHRHVRRADGPGDDHDLDVHPPRRRARATDVPAAVELRRHDGDARSRRPTSPPTPCTPSRSPHRSTDAAGNPLGTRRHLDVHDRLTGSPSSTRPPPTSARARPAPTTYVSETGDGEVILAPTVGAEFEGDESAQPAGPARRGPADGASTVAGGPVAVDGALLATTAHVRTGTLDRVRRHLRRDSVPARRLRPGPRPRVTESWAMFSTCNTSDDALRGTNNGRAAADDSPVRPRARCIGSPHRYRIDWTRRQLVLLRRRRRRAHDRGRDRGRHAAGDQRLQRRRRRRSASTGCG